MGKHPSLQAELTSWCKDVGIEEKHAVMLFNVHADTEVAVIEDVMQAVKVLGRICVRDTREGPTSHTMLVLCECKQAVDVTRLPSEMNPDETGEPWAVVVVSAKEILPDASSEEFTEKLTKFLMGEGKSVADIKALFTPRSSDAGSAESNIRAVGEILVKTSKPSGDSSAYRRLRTFSAIETPTVAPSNADQVIQKLVRSLRRAKSGKPEETRDCKKDSNCVCFTKRSQPEVYGSGGLPKRLVGPASTVEVELNGCLCQALLDSGSQVAIVFENWYSKNLRDVPIHPLTGLSKWGLSSSSYPYKGYIVVDVTFPASVTGVEESLCILAIVCPEPQGPSQLPVIIGTNASFFNRLAVLSQEFEGSSVANSLRIQTRHSEILIPKLSETDHLSDKPEERLKWMGPGQ